MVTCEPAILGSLGVVRTEWPDTRDKTEHLTVVITETMFIYAQIGILLRRNFGQPHLIFISKERQHPFTSSLFSFRLKIFVFVRLPLQHYTCIYLTPLTGRASIGHAFHHHTTIFAQV